MGYLSVSDTAKAWGLSERSVRNYCAQGRIAGAFLTGKTWNIPEDAQKPQRANAKVPHESPLLATLRREKQASAQGGIYHKVQVELTYNSNHIEGSRLSLNQTRYIFETSTLEMEDGTIPVDDVVEAVNHFRCIDYIIDHAQEPLAEKLVKDLHRILKSSTSDSRISWFAAGDYKRLPNEVGGMATSAPEDVSRDIREALDSYQKIAHPSLNDIIAFHVAFERIHPFQDGNGRVGRLVVFKECLRCGIVPFIITDDMKMCYYRGLANWDSEKGYLVDTCLSAQDGFKASLEYFCIPF